MINLVVITTTQSLHLANLASYPQTERTSDMRCHFLSTTKSKKIFIEWIWLGKILANDIQFAKFAKVFPVRYTVMGYLTNFTNGPMSHENFCWAVSKVRLWVLVGMWNASTSDQ